jgi:hypothetical protein
MTHLEAIRHMSLDRRRQLGHETGVERLGLQARRRRQQRRRRVALDVAFDLLLRGRHNPDTRGAAA